MTVAGQVGNFPSILNPLDGSDLGVDLPGLSADVEEGVYQYWKRDGSRVTGTIFDAGLIVPGTSTQSFSSGLYRRFRVEGDPALLPGSIKAGTTIFGVGGQFPSQEYPLSEAMGSDLPHLSSTLAAGSYQWWKQDGTRVTGNILSASGGGSITPGTSTQVFDAGVYRAFSVLGDSALLPSSIVNSVAIFGVPGTAIESYMPTPEGPLVSTTVRASCAAHLTSGETSSGRYLIDPDGAAGPAPIMEGQCDMTTDGGGWTLVLNYLHKGSATSPELKSLTLRLPLLEGTTLGIDESTSAVSWGHAVPGLLGQFSLSTLRFQCTNSIGHHLHFKTSAAGCVSYMKTGLGSCAGAGADPSTANLSGLSLNLPTLFTEVAGSRGEHALTSDVFRENLFWGWSIINAPFYGSFMCGHSGQTDDTHHSVWIK